MPAFLDLGIRDLMPEEDVESESQDLENLDTGSIDDNGSLDHISSEDMDEACRAAPTPGVINRAADAARIPLARLSDHSN
ncbi:unnamed protein product [Protopolystoma xenopodis]|uniref:Uncharacterized protein n=1 Tax=Protopolystoma xenopodis TaxID=117903 RepID=A0A3S4ZU34_9PLAT|nr:unnamed protein product [Protopolystoma xenopodis]